MKIGAVKPREGLSEEYWEARKDISEDEPKLKKEIYKERGDSPYESHLEQLPLVKLQVLLHHSWWLFASLLSWLAALNKGP